MREFKQKFKQSATIYNLAALARQKRNYLVFILLSFCVLLLTATLNTAAQASHNNGIKCQSLPLEIGLGWEQYIGQDKLDLNGDGVYEEEGIAAVQLAQAANWPNTLPNVRGIAFAKNIENPFRDYSTSNFLEVVGPGTGNPNATVPIKVLLPPSYFEECHANKYYPVVYMFDGQTALDDGNAFDLDENDGVIDTPYTKREMLIDEILADKSVQKRLAGGIGEAIVVIVPAQYTSPRTEDPNRNPRVISYVFWPGTDEVREDIFNFITITLRNEINTVFRTLADRNQTVIAGLSNSCALVENLAIDRPDFAGKLIAMKNLGQSYPVENPFFPLWTVEKFEALCNEGEGLKYYLQRGGDATSGLDFSGSVFSQEQVDWLLDNTPFELYDGSNPNANCLLIVNNFEGRRGNTHRNVTHHHGLTLLDGLLKLYNQDEVPLGEPFHMIVEPDVPKKPKILAVGNAENRSVRLELRLPKFDGTTLPNTDAVNVGIFAWGLATINLTTGEKTLDYINAETLNALRSSGQEDLFDGVIRENRVDLVKTTDLEWTVTGLNPGDKYQFKVCAENTVSTCSCSGVVLDDCLLNNDPSSFSKASNVVRLAE